MQIVHEFTSLLFLKSCLSLIICVTEGLHFAKKKKNALQRCYDFSLYIYHWNTYTEVDNTGAHTNSSNFIICDKIWGYVGLLQIRNMSLPGDADTSFYYHGFQSVFPEPTITTSLGNLVQFQILSTLSLKVRNTKSRASFQSMLVSSQASSRWQRISSQLNSLG